MANFLLFCLLQVSEFNLSVKTDCFKLPQQGIYIVWEWEWIEIESQSEDDTSDLEENPQVNEENPYLQTDDESDDNSSNALAAQTHVVTFKCVGSNHDAARQNILSEVGQALRQGCVVTARAEPEPSNQYDSKAIAFQVHWKDNWQTIGYVVRECLDHVHHALMQKRLLSVELAWAKYLVCWSASGPGFYAGINMTIKGTWHPDVVRSQSTR